MAGRLPVGRGQVLAYRIAAQDLGHRVHWRPADLPVLDLGVQDTPYGSARLALAARTSAPLDDDALRLVWSYRGAPHLHRSADLPRIATALWPLSDADAGKRVASSQVEGLAALGLSAFRAAADAFRTVVTAPMPRGAVSTEVSTRVPGAATYACRACAATHISGSLFQQAGLAGGVRLELTGKSTMLAPIDGWSGPPRQARDTDSLVLAYLRLLGPATVAEVAAFLGTNRTDLRAVWPEELAEVEVEGRPAWLPADRLAELRGAPEPRLVRLLPPGDPYLQARDRTLLVPDEARRSQVWRMLGNPGALLVDGEVAGTWRAKLAGKARLELSVAPFGALTKTTRAAIDEEADRVARARGVADVRVEVAKPA